MSVPKIEIESKPFRSEMDLETVYFLLILVVIGVLSYYALRYITMQYFINEINAPSEMDKSGETVIKDRNSKGTTSTMSHSSSATDTVSDEVPSRERIDADRLEIQRRRYQENASDNCTAADDDSGNDEDESNDEEDENRVFQTFVDEAKLKEYTDENGIIRGLMKYINENLQIWMTRKLKIAVIGNSGTGKSSLINAMRGLRAEDKGAAPVGVTETTVEKQEYFLPDNENVSLWDLPGVGTQNFRREDYLKNVNLKDFDAFMIVSATRFSENDIWLANEILKHQSYIFFLRTKIDFDLTNEKSDHPSKYNETDCLRNLRLDMVNNLKKADFPQKKRGIFLVSSRESDRFDFPNLLLRLNKILRKKRFALRRVLENHLQNHLKKKRDQKKNGFLGQQIALWLGLGSVEFHTLRMYRNCKVFFSVDDNTLEMISDKIGVSVRDLKYNELNYFRHIEDQFFKENFTNIFHAVLSYFTSSAVFKKRLNYVCDVLADDEAKLVHLCLNYLEELLKPF